VNEPAFLTLAEVLDIHRLQIEEFGGARGLRDLGLLESALAVPQASFGGELLHGSLFEMAAAYAYHIVENQPFLDGNKRTALAAALVFLDLNGFAVEEPKGELYDLMMDIAAKRLDKKGLVEVFGKLARRL
jgi:death on curing protein